jgi:hypothetical protein
MTAPKRPTAKREKASAVSPTGERAVSARDSVLKGKKQSRPLETFEEPADRGSDDAKLLAKPAERREESI